MPRRMSEAEFYHVTASEAEIQRQIVEGLRWKGYTVLVTSRHRKRGASHEGDGCDKGIGDLLVWATGKLDILAGDGSIQRADYGAWLMLEVKSKTGRLTKEQAELEQQGMLHVVRSLDDALKVLEGG